MKNSFFKTSVALFVSASLLTLTACGGSGSGSKHSNTANVRVTVDASLFDSPSESLRYSKLDNPLNIFAKPYNLEGEEVPGVQYIQKKATYQDDDSYFADLEGLNPSFEYRFEAWYGDNKILENHVDVASITNNAKFEVDIYTTYKTIAYDAWLKKIPSDKSFKTFLNNSSKAGLIDKKDYANIVDNSISISNYMTNLSKTTKKGEKFDFPEAQNINVDNIPTSDKSDEPETPEEPEIPEIPEEPEQAEQTAQTEQVEQTEQPGQN